MRKFANLAFFNSAKINIDCYNIFKIFNRKFNFFLIQLTTFANIVCIKSTNNYIINAKFQITIIQEF